MVDRAETRGNGDAAIIREKEADAWARRAPELARWAWDRYVVRDDVWGGYNPLDVREQTRKRADGTVYKLGPTCTRPTKKNRGLVKLTLAPLEQHFRATRPEHVIGAHTTSLNNHSRFGTVEIDWHGPDSTAPDTNERAAKGWYQALRTRGFRPLLWDSNRAGGFHLDILLASLIPTPRPFWFLRELVSNHAAYGLPARPETFPKQSELRPKPDGRGAYGNWVRLPGRHHTRDVWARVWDGSEWTEGERAIDYLLSLHGDSPDLIPERDEKAHRIRAYLAKVPHGTEGTGRDDRAFNVAAFLVRDMALDDGEALRWLEEWDGKNRPPKGRERLTKIIANAHDYGRNGYGSGLNGSHSAGAISLTPPAPPPTPAQAQDGLAVILADFQERYQPRFRRGTAIYSDSLGREVKPTEACFAADKSLLAKLAMANNAPLDKRGEVDASALPRYFWTWSKSAWAELLHTLPEEEATEEISASAEEQFRRQVAACLFAQVVFAQVVDAKTGAAEQQRRTLLQWCQLWAKPGKWEQVRSALLWCRKDTGGQLCLALRVELFGQYGPRELTSLSQRAFGRLAELYGVGEAQRAAGERVVELSQAFVETLRTGPELVQQTGELTQ